MEGFEKEVILGAINTIKEFHPWIMLESWDSDNSIIEILEYLIPLGYEWIQFSVCDYLFY